MSQFWGSHCFKKCYWLTSNSLYVQVEYCLFFMFPIGNNCHSCMLFYYEPVLVSLLVAIRPSFQLHTHWQWATHFRKFFFIIFPVKVQKALLPRKRNWTLSRKPLVEHYPDIVDARPVDIFRYFFDAEMKVLIIDQSNLSITSHLTSAKEHPVHHVSGTSRTVCSNLAAHWLPGLEQIR